MVHFFHPLLTLIASATDRELARYVQFLKEENKILRARLGKRGPHQAGGASAAVQFGKALGPRHRGTDHHRLPATFYRWVPGREVGKKKAESERRPAKPREIRELVIEIAKTTGFGYTRIIGEIPETGDQRHQPADGAEHPQGRRASSRRQTALRTNGTTSSSGTRTRCGRWISSA